MSINGLLLLNYMAMSDGQQAPSALRNSLLAIHIKRVIKACCLTQVQAADVPGLDQPKISAIASGRLEGCSTDRLVTNFPMLFSIEG